MQSRLELWGQAKRKRIEISEQLTNFTQQVREFSIASFQLHFILLPSTSCLSHWLFIDSGFQLNAMQQQYSDALKTSLKIQEASHEAMSLRFQEMDLGISNGPSHAEELHASLKELLLDEDSDDHRLLVQVCSLGFLRNVLVVLTLYFAVLEGHQQDSSASNCLQEILAHPYDCC